MDGSAFDALARTLTTAGSRRRALSGLFFGSLGILSLSADDAVAHDLKATCKKKSGEAKKKCLKRTKKHVAEHAAEDASGGGGGGGNDQPPPVCSPACTGGRLCQAGGICACPSGTRACFDGSCGACCSNFDCCTPREGEFICTQPGSQTCLPRTVVEPRVCGASCTDGVQNGTESDVDCGGSCPRCSNGKRCTTHQDCVSAKCGAGRCVECLTSADCQGTQTCTGGTCGYGGDTGDGGGGGGSGS
jgi:hypothetical protein